MPKAQVSRANGRGAVMFQHAALLLEASLLAFPATPATHAPTDSIVVATPAPAPARARFSGLTFGDLYWNVDGDPAHRYALDSGADSGKVNLDASGRPITRDLNGVQLRRINLQVDYDLAPNWATRVRLEMDHRTLTSDGKMSPFVKHAYLQRKDVGPMSDVLVGMMDTPTFQTAEAYWGYRSVERTVADFLGLASSSELGLRANVAVDSTRHAGVYAMVGTGTGQRLENNRQKRFYLAVPFRVSKIHVEPYVDYEDWPAGNDRATYRLFTGAKFGRGTVGLELYDRVQHASGGNGELRAGSLFGHWMSAKQLGVFARVDYWDPDVRTDDRVRQWLWIGGLDWEPAKNVHLMPNFEAMRYDAQGAAVAPSANDLQVRLTFYCRFPG